MSLFEFISWIKFKNYPYNDDFNLENFGEIFNRERTIFKGLLPNILPKPLIQMESIAS